MRKQTTSHRIPASFFCAILILCFTTAVSAQGLNFSVDFSAVGLPGTAVAADNDPADVFIGGGNNNMKRLDKTQLGLGALDNVDAVAFAIPVWYEGGPVYVEPENVWSGVGWYFSVDPAAVGVGATAVNTEQAKQPPEAAGDTFLTHGQSIGSNALAVDEGTIGLDAPGHPEDDEDSLDIWAPFLAKPLPRGSVFFSLDIGSPSLSNPPGFTEGDILMSDGNGGFELAVPPYIWSDLGNAPWFVDGSAASLGIAGQDLDALFMDSANFPYFSIAGTYGTIDPGDICVPDGLSTWPPSAPDGFADVVITYAQLGLLVADNVNALDAYEGSIEEVPDPEETWFVCVEATGKNYIQSVPDHVQPPSTGSANWCSPTAALNVIEFWEVIQGHLNAVGLIDPLDLVFPGGRVRTLSTTNDWIGWFMDTNNLTGTTDDLRGNGNDAHAGTYNKDIDLGLDDFINWDGTTTGNEPGWFPASYVKTPIPWDISADLRVLGDPTSEPNAWTNMKAEIDAGRPVIMSFVHWNIQNPVNALLSGVSGSIGASFYEWGAAAGSGSPGGGAGTENWNQRDDNPPLNVGHTVTVVGYIEQCDVDGAGSWPTADWVIVHDNWTSTPTNVAVPWADFTNAPPFDPDTWWGNNGPVVEVSWWTGSVYSDPDLDFDSDGMPDWWENLYGLNPGSGADAGTDLDGDGMTNLQEYNNGTDPTDTDSDDDGFSDYKEDQDGTDPNDLADNTPFTPVWVDFGGTGIEMGTSGQPTSTMGDAIKQVSVGGTLKITDVSGTNNTTETPTITKAMRIEAVAGPIVIGQ
jgi:hypothetical protein